jgi:hypothetical protein
MEAAKKRRWFHRQPESPTGTVEEGTSLAVMAPPESEPTVRADFEGMLSRLTDYVRVQVRSGAYDVSALRDLTLDAAGSETDDPQRADELARQVLFAELQSWQADADGWVGRTDTDRLDAALDRLAAEGVLVFAALGDSSAVAESMRIRGGAHGCVSYLVADIWRALDTNDLVLTVLNNDGSAAARRSPLVTRLVDLLADEGLLASAPASGQGVVVSINWRRRPS